MTLFTPQFEKRKRRRNYILASLFLIGFGVVLGGVSALSYIPALKIKNITVTGASTISAAEVEQMVEQQLSQKYWHLFSKANALIFPKDQIAQGIMAEWNRVEAVDVREDSAHSIHISITERKPYYLWCGDEKQFNQNGTDCYYADVNGKVYSQAPQFGGVVYTRFYIASTTQSDLSVQTDSQTGSDTEPHSYIASDKGLEAYKTFVQLLNQKYGLIVDKVLYTNTGMSQFDIVLQSGPRILLDPSADVVKQFNNMAGVIDANDLKFNNTFNNTVNSTKGLKDSSLSVDYIDLRFTNKVYYKLKQ